MRTRGHPLRPVQRRSAKAESLVPLLRTIARTVAVEVKVLSWSDRTMVGRQACRVTIPKGRRSGNPHAPSFWMHHFPRVTLFAPPQLRDSCRNNGGDDGGL
jgi:hypothetical protein